MPKTNTKRINLIKTRREFLLHCMDHVGNGVANLQSIYNDLGWLIEQAERVKVLEEENKRLRRAVQRMETASNLVLETIREQALQK